MHEAIKKWLRLILFLKICELHMAGFSFYLMSNSFLVHDGFKHNNSECYHQKMHENKINFNLFSTVSNLLFFLCYTLIKNVVQNKVSTA